ESVRASITGRSESISPDIGQFNAVTGSVARGDRRRPIATDAFEARVYIKVLRCDVGQAAVVDIPTVAGGRRVVRRAPYFPWVARVPVIHSTMPGPIVDWSTAGPQRDSPPIAFRLRERRVPAATLMGDNRFVLSRFRVIVGV